MKTLKIRNTKPTKGNKFYIRRASGGWNTCVLGNPTDKYCNVLANCVGYAEGRFNEIIGKWKYSNLNCNAENFIERAKQAGLKISKVPTLGGIMVWQRGATLTSKDGAGHVAIVERIDSANQIYTSESGYKSAAFWNSTRTNNNGRWGQGSAYKFRGCIINPEIGDEHWIEPETDIIYVVKKGDTLSRIAKQYGTTWEQLAAYNDLKHANNISIGQKIKIPQKGFYVVKSGDTLSKIARMYKTTWQELKRINGLSNADKIYVGQRLRIK